MSRFLSRALVVALALLLAGANTPVLARTMEKSDADVAQQATPAVVNIAAWKMRPAAKPGDPPRRIRIYASGFIIDPAGTIVTNKHVIDGAFDVTVIFSDGDQAPASLLATAAMMDVAVLKVDVDHPLPVLKWGNSDPLRVGDSVLAIGNPLGIGMSVSAGIVSALNRDLQDTPFDDYIQTDAAINRGNSGGPLLNRSGEVVGVDTALFNTDPTGGFIGIGFAIPSADVKFVVDQLLDPTHPKLGWIGTKLQDVTGALAQALGLPSARGAIVASIDPNSPAREAAIRPGDILVKLDNDMLGDSRAYMRGILLIGPGKPARLSIWRDGEEQLVTVPVAEWPNIMAHGGMMTGSMAQAMMQQPADPGVQFAPITDAARQEYGLDPKLTGVVVTAVEQDCEAAELGVVPGDVVTMVQAEPVATPADVKRVLASAHEQHRPSIAVLVQGKGGSRWLSLSMGHVGA
jgi:serine protease Do